MKKLILLALAIGAGVLAKNKSEQLKAGAAKVAQDPRVQSALATAQDKAGPLAEKAAPYAETVKDKVEPYAETVKEKAAPYAETVKEKAAPYAETVKEKVDSVTHHDSTGDEPSADAADDVVDEGELADVAPDPLTDPLPDDKR